MTEQDKLYRRLSQTCKSNYCQKGKFEDGISQLCDECYDKIEKIQLTKEVVEAIWSQYHSSR